MPFSCVAAVLLVLSSVLRLGSLAQKSNILIAVGGLMTAACWIGTAPMCVFTFLEHYDWTGKRIVPVCTNEGSGLANSEKDIAASCPGATMMPGLDIKGHQCSTSEEMLAVWAQENI